MATGLIDRVQLTDETVFKKTFFKLCFSHHFSYIYDTMIPYRANQSFKLLHARWALSSLHHSVDTRDITAVKKEKIMWSWGRRVYNKYCIKEGDRCSRDTSFFVSSINSQELSTY